MLTNYIKIAWRNLLKNRMFSLINIGGLSISVTFCILLFLHIRHEQSFDTFHKNGDRLFRVEMTNMWLKAEDQPKKHFFSFLTGKHEVKNGLVFAPSTAGDIEANFPDVVAAVQIKGQGDFHFRIGDNIFNVKQTMQAGPDFFSSFSFPLIEGNPSTALSGVNNIVLSETTAGKFFGKESALGKTISTAGDDPKLFIVTGVAADAPINSSIQFDVLFPTPQMAPEEISGPDKFNSLNNLIVLELKPGVNPQQFEAKLNNWVKTYFTEPFFEQVSKYDKKADGSKMRWSLRPLADCHYNIASPWGHFTNAKNIYQLACLVLIILLIAALNYVLLAVSNGAARSQEIGVRKVMGAQRKSVIFQFWAEAQLTILIAVVAGMLLAQTFIPVFNEMIGTKLNIADFYRPGNLLGIFVLTLLLGLLAGYYPALFLSRLKPVSIIKSFQTFKINPRFSKILVVSQYSICIILMMAALVINLQMRFISNKDLGFDKEQVLLVENKTYDKNETKKIFGRLKQYAASTSAISGFSAITGGLDGSGNRNGFKLNGEQQWLRQMDVDYSYFDFMKIPIVKGRVFSPLNNLDTVAKLRTSVVNESLFKLLPDAKLGEYNETIRSTIVGVVKDYHMDNLAKKIEPQQHVLLRGYIRYFMFRLQPGNGQERIAEIQSAWKKASDNLPFEYSFLDDNISMMYEAESRWQKIIQASCIFAILIACMGLFGLSAINTSNRTKEIGIRKILGAEVGQLVAKLSFGFLVMVFIALVIAIPISLWVMTRWLEDFEYRIQISWWMYLLVATMALLIAVIAVGIQSLKAALANPVKSLRTE